MHEASPLFFVTLYCSIMLSLEGWRRRDPEREIWRRIAFVTRYGHIGYSEAMTMPVSELRSYAEALGDLVKDENDAMRVD